MPADAFTAGQFAWDARLLTASATTGLVRPVHGARVLRRGGAVAQLRRAPRRRGWSVGIGADDEPGPLSLVSR